MRKNPDTESSRPRILVAPLDWGLGHSTRCIPIIRELLAQDCDVYIAGDGKVLSLLKKEFAHTVFLRYRGYEIAYSQNSAFFRLNLALQIPRVFFRILKENKWLKKTVERYKIDAVISDNRFGMHHPDIPCIYITHQLQIKTGNRFTEKMAQKIHYHFIRKFSDCWVPDFEQDGLAGELSHPAVLPGKVSYLGALSRFSPRDGVDKVYDLLLLISGPEPQRSIFEDIALQQLQAADLKVLIARGLPGQPEKPDDFNRVTIKNHLTAAELNEALLQSELVLCRSGYTSIMDLTVLKKKAVLVPTPGQTEQEYLATHMEEKGYFPALSQDHFTIEEAFNKSAGFQFNKPRAGEGQYRKAVEQLMDTLKDKAS